MRKKRILLGASYSVIEPLGLLHLGGLARDEGWERRFHLVRDHDFTSFFETVRDFKPDIVGFNVYTGNHIQTHRTLERLKKDFPGTATIVGGPHPTYFPSESAEHADFVVMSEGFGALRKILRGEAKPGILPMGSTERFPHPDRETFYGDYPEHGRSRIKSIITMTGCPYTCTYCYNSSTPSDIKDNMPADIAERLGKAMGMGGRLFPHNVRDVEEVVREGREISERWPTEVIYSQDDVHGFDINKWMPEFARLWPENVGLPYHAQMRWEMTRGDAGSKRLDILREAGCFGLTLAIEAADPVVRKEVLARGMPEEIMFEGMQKLIDRGMRVRTEQITALPYGATSSQTPMNLDADLQLIELNVNLRRETGGPTMAWGSTFAPYRGTKLGTYCEVYGHYKGDNSDVPDTFFDRSVLRFPKNWVGKSLAKLKDEEGIWMDPIQLENYRTRNAELRRHFNFFALVPQGHKLARTYLTRPEPFSYGRLGIETEEHLRKINGSDEEARRILSDIDRIRKSIDSIPELQGSGHRTLRDGIKSLAPYFACLPESDVAVQKAIEYAHSRGNGSLTQDALSTSVRHHLYDNVLYETGSIQAEEKRPVVTERYPSKV